MVINNNYDKLINCNNACEVEDYLIDHKIRLYFLFDHKPTLCITYISQYNNSNNNTVKNNYNKEIMIVLKYLKGDMYWINNDIIYNDIVDDMNVLFYFVVNTRQHESNAAYYGLFKFLYIIYGSRQQLLDIFKKRLIKKIIEMMNT
jgi:hypothetical protein